MFYHRYTFSSCYKCHEHCVKYVRFGSYSGPHFSRIFSHSDWILEILRISLYSVRMRENAWKIRTRITPNTDTFYAVKCKKKNKSQIWHIVVPHMWCLVFCNPNPSWVGAKRTTLNPVVYFGLYFFSNLPIFHEIWWLFVIFISD